MKAERINSNNALQDMIQLLTASGLPSKDISLKGNLFLGYYDERHTMTGCGGLEYFNDYALLRSIAVTTDVRGQSLGKQIVQDLIGDTRSKSVKKIFLLTETAPEFFKRFGFQVVSRDLVPDEVKNSSEFTTVCPVSALCMELIL